MNFGKNEDATEIIPLPRSDSQKESRRKKTAQLRADISKQVMNIVICLPSNRTISPNAHDSVSLKPMTGKHYKSGQAPDKQLACPLCIINTIITTIYWSIYAQNSTIILKLMRLL